MVAQLLSFHSVCVLIIITFIGSNIYMMSKSVLCFGDI